MAAALTLAAVGLSSGCVVFGGSTAFTQAGIDDPSIAFAVCASGAAPGACADKGASGYALPAGNGQLLLGIQVSAGLDLPASFASTGPEALAFTRSPSLTAELQRLAPAPAGARWLGYISALIVHSDTSGPQSAPITLPASLVKAADGGPVVGTPGVRAVLGARQVTADAPASRPVTCGVALGTRFAENDGTPKAAAVICGDSTLTYGAIAVHDLGVLSVRPAAGAPGATVAVPFALRFAGPAGPGYQFALSAGTSMPGAAATVAPAVAPASDSTTAVPVSVTIPAGTAPGTYDVTLTATLNGSTRVGVGRLTVGAPPVAITTRRLRLTTTLPRGLSLTVARTRGIRVVIRSTGAGRATIRLFQGKGRRAKVVRRVRLTTTGPVSVRLKSAALTRGGYRVVVTLGTTVVTTRASLRR